MPECHFTVAGVPAQMGSKKAFVRGGRAIITDDNSAKRRTWANAVTAAAADAMAGAAPFDGPVAVHVTFCFLRPNSHFGTGRNRNELKKSAPSEHAQSPDLDKLLRCLLDAMTGVVYRDDKQVFDIQAQRVWSATAGAGVRVSAVGGAA